MFATTRRLAPPYPAPHECCGMCEAWAARTKSTSRDRPGQGPMAFPHGAHNEPRPEADRPRCKHAGGLERELDAAHGGFDFGFDVGFGEVGDDAASWSFV